MFATVYAAVFAAILFYAVLPVIGAVVVRRQWRSFRLAVKETQSLPELRYGIAEPTHARLTGRVDALGGDDELWVRSEAITAAVPLGRAWVYMLSGDRGKRFGGDEVSRMHWTSIRSVSPGTRALVAGEARVADGKTVIGSPGSPPLVILYDGDDASMPVRAVRAGRHSNEYWNPLSQVSIAMGVLAMSGIVSVSLTGGAPSTVSAVILTAAFSPLLPLLPPGLVFFFVYRFYWKLGRECRARRDLAILRQESRAHKAWRSKSVVWTGAAIASFAAAFVVNAWLLILSIRSLL